MFSDVLVLVHDVAAVALVSGHVTGTNMADIPAISIIEGTVKFRDGKKVRFLSNLALFRWNFLSTKALIPSGIEFCMYRTQV